MNKPLVSGILTLLVMSISLISAGPIDSKTCPGYGMMSGLYGSYGSGFMILGWITYILLIVLIIAAIYWLIKNANKKK